MNNLHIYIILFLISLFYSCSALVDCCLKPSRTEFTNKYTGDYTGIDTLISVDGYFQFTQFNEPSPRENIMFYSNGIVCITYESVIDPFINEDSPAVIWGTYQLCNDTINCQFIEKNYVLKKVEVSKITYLIQSKDKLQRLKESDIRTTYVFHHLDRRIGYDNWLLKKKWFYKKEK